MPQGQGSRLRARRRRVCNGRAWTGSPNKSLDQIGKNCPKNVQKLSRGAESTIFGQFLDNFWAFFRHFVDIPFFWAVQRFARYNAVCSFATVVLYFPEKPQIGNCHVESQKTRTGNWGETSWLKMKLLTHIAIQRGWRSVLISDRGAEGKGTLILRVSGVLGWSFSTVGAVFFWIREWPECGVGEERNALTPLMAVLLL